MLPTLLRQLLGLPSARERSRCPRKWPHTKPLLELLEDRNLLSVATAFVNDNWHLVTDVDNDSMLSQYDEISNLNDAINPGGITAFYGLNGFGAVTSGPIGVTLAADPNFDGINDAIANTTVGGTVNVLGGTYTENVVIDKNLTLLSQSGRATATITGIANGALGTVVLTNNTTDVQIGAAGRGFTIVGIDNPSPGVESAAVYFQGGHSGTTILDNEIRAVGDLALVTEFNQTYSGLVISGNTFSGQTFVGPFAGTGAQDTVPNVPRALVFIGTSSSNAATDIVFSNNMITGTAGGVTALSVEQGNTLVTIDAADSTITGNTFAGTTTGFGGALRVRRPGTTISGNTFESEGMGLGTTHLFLLNNATPLQDVIALNTFDRGAYTDNFTTLSVSIAGGVGRAAPGSTVKVLAGTYVENVVINKDLTLQGVGPTTFLNPSGGVGVNITAPASDVVLQNFRISGADSAINSAALTELTLSGLTLTGNTSGGTLTDVATINLLTDPGTVDETVNVTPTQFGVQGQDAITYSGTTQLNVSTLGGNDTINVIPSASTAISVDGGTHTTGDTLTVDTLDQAATTTSTQVLVPGRQPVNYVNIESVILNSLFFDDFNRANNASLGSSWTELTPGFGIVGNRAVPDASPVSLAVANGVSETDVAVSADVVLGTTPGAIIGVVARKGAGGDQNLYLGGLTNDGGQMFADIWRNVGGSWTRLSHQPVAPANNVTVSIRLQVVGSSLTLFVSGFVYGTASDTMLSGPGGVGIRSSGVSAGIGLDNFRAQRVGPVFADNFNRADAGSLGSAWANAVGGFGVTANQAKPTTSAANLATANGVSAADVSLRADVTLGVANGVIAGLIARKGSGGDQNFYYGALVNINGGLFADIWRNVGGAWSLLSRQSVGAASAGNHSVRFDVIGSSLKLFVDGTLSGSATDTMIGGAGLVGIRAGGPNAAIALDNFEVK